MSALATLSPSVQEDLHSLLVERMRPMLVHALESAEPGQRLRVTTLPESVMDGVCRSLHGDERWVARVLAPASDDCPWRATATKIIELRNALEKPLLVFIPPGLRTAAEDSLDIATFNELSLAALAQDLVGELLQRVPENLRTEVVGVLGHLREQRHIRNMDEEVEYLLAVLKNGATAAAAGGALYVFGLLPDFQLFTRGNVLFWLSRNLKVSDLLATGQPLQTAVLRMPIKPNTIQARIFGFLRVRQRGDVRTWARDIAAVPEHRPLAMDEWDFVDTGTTEDLRLVVQPLSLPRQTEDSVVGATQLPVLNLEGRDPLKVAFRSIPLPSQATAWKAWRVQIMSLRDGAPTVAWESNSYPKPQRQAKVSRAIKTQDLHALEEGTYFLKVDAYDADGALLTKPRRVDEDDPSSRAENESERFLVIKGPDIDVVPEEPRSIFCSSLLDAWVRVATKSLGAKKRESVPERAAVHGEWSEPMGAPLKGDVNFELKSEGFTGFSVVVPSTLRRIEREILEHADKLGVYALSFLDVRTVSDVEVKLKEPVTFGSGPDVDAFLAARREVFCSIYQHHFKGEGDPKENTASRAGLLETVDLAPITEHIDRYSAA
jgi:hypothetical protein